MSLSAVASRVAERGTDDLPQEIKARSKPTWNDGRVLFGSEDFGGRVEDDVASSFQEVVRFRPHQEVHLDTSIPRPS